MNLAADHVIISYHSGNLRCFGGNPVWAELFRKYLGDATIFAENAFGTQYCLQSDGTVSILYPESGDIEHLGTSVEEFFEDIANDPENTIDQELYEQAQLKFGPISTDVHYAFVIELALGGNADIANLQIMDADKHMEALSFIADQIHDHPIGTKYTHVVLED